MTRFLMLAICLTVPAFAQSQPVIRSVVNAASNTDPLLPNSSIARGSMFVIKGEGLGPDAIVVDTTFPLGTTFQGTSVKVASLVNNLSWDAILYYVGGTQVAAILPSVVPEGLAKIRLTYNGQESTDFTITVVKSSLGLFSVNSSGAGDAIATRADNFSFLSPTNPAKPNDLIVLWGTGLGPIDGDEKNAAPQFDMTTVPVEAWVGGKPATIVFRGRNSCCTSVDTVYLRVPAGLAGCMTPVTLKVGSSYSNTVLIPTTQSGNVCTSTNPSVTTSDLSQLVSKTTLWTGSIVLGRAVAPSNTTVQPAGATFDGGVGSFSQVQVVPGWLGFTYWDFLHSRSCNVTTTGGFVGYATVTQLGAGTITVNGPNGGGQLNYDPVLRFNYGTLGASGDFVRPGMFDVNTGFINNSTASASLNLPALLNWTNRNQISSIDRNTGLTVTWTGGDPSGYVQIAGVSTTLNGRSDQLYASFWCLVPVSDGSFTVPPYVLSALPATQSGHPALLTLSGIASAKRLTGGGLDISYGAIMDNIASNVTYR